MDLNQVLKENAMLSVAPHLFLQWDFDKNDSELLNIYNMKKGSKEKVFWKCDSCKSSYKAAIYSRVKGSGCPYCAGQATNEINCLSTLNPEIAREWHVSLNKELTPETIYYKSRSKVWWKCGKCNSDYETSVVSRIVKNTACPYCAGKKANKTNSLEAMYPQLTLEWHPTKNLPLLANEITPGSKKSVWWLCSKNHEWEAPPTSRTGKNSGCPYCSNKKVLIGYNDMWTTNKEMASLLLNPEDGYLYTEVSGKKANWKCPDCQYVINNKKIANVYNSGLYCPKCSDGTSYPEKFMISLLTQKEIDFEHERSFEWSNKRRYDIYISQLKCIIELHGGQHYGNVFKVSRKSEEDEPANDLYKMQLALENGIEHYIVIDTAVSRFDYVKNSVLNSKLQQLIDLTSVDWELVQYDSLRSKVIQCCELWNQGIRSTFKIRDMVNGVKEVATVINYLKKGVEIGLCDYNSEMTKTPGRKVKKYDLDGNFLCEYNSVKHAARENDLSPTSVKSACLSINKTAKGFKWEFCKQ